ncbi:MAG: pyruvate dehydrogenase complex dihydrolipoamide acetyltransferase [Bacteroidetes bacterium]|nr:pyruvate dehydrogenase complex dihydrolipoamide acetyltransferase [Bacteroidota bacterium]MCH8523890.1 pyruvate dehydrogenase complex dihydrolipoamide acetyltransferase [Balneolales bacterium]
MAIIIDMPKLSDTMEEGVISKWNIKEGDAVKSGDIIAEVETDKATMDVEAFDDGVVLKIMAKEGEAVPLGGKMVIIGEKGEDISDLLGGDSAKDDKGSSDEKKSEKSAKSEKSEPEKSDSKKDFDPLFGDLEKSEEKPSEESSDDDSSRLKASPLARKIAEDQGIKLSQVKGSGPNGRIVKKDVESFDGASVATEEKKSDSKAPSMPVYEISAEDQEFKISQMRKTIAKRLAESKFTNPHFYETIDIDMKRAMEARTAMNAAGDVKISFNDLVVKACAKALRLHPKMNSSWLGDVIKQHGGVHVAVAVAIDDGLVTPVIRNADVKGLAQISAETKELAGKARDKKLQPEDWEGSTFTISNLGMYGIEEFTAIINPPNAAILAVGAIRDVPVVENGQVVPGKRMKVTLSSDHRVVDGATCAEFLNTVRKFLENPTTMLVY